MGVIKKCSAKADAGYTAALLGYVNVQDALVMHIRVDTV
jgi:hypothetical protein